MYIHVYIEMLAALYRGRPPKILEATQTISSRIRNAHVLKNTICLFLLWKRDTYFVPKQNTPNKYLQTFGKQQKLDNTLRPSIEETSRANTFKRNTNAFTNGLQGRSTNFIWCG